MRCRWNNITGQSRRRKRAHLRRMQEFKRHTDACEHEFEHAWFYGEREWLACAKRCGTLTWKAIP